MADLTELQKQLGITFHDISLLEHALIHSSFVNENSQPGLTSNERMEFFGDAVLGFVVAEKLFTDYPEMTEGGMTKLRATLVRRETLARIAKRLTLGDYLYLGKGEEGSGGRSKPANLASLMEAVIAAVFYDRGIEETRNFILTHLQPELEIALEEGAGIDYKSELQQIIQASTQKPPVYTIVDASGPDHSKVFTAEVSVDGTVLGRGRGRSKKTAEAEAARAAIQSLPDTFTL